MKTILRLAMCLAPLLAAGLFAVGGCSTSGHSSLIAGDSERAMMEALKGYKAAWNRHDVAALTAYFEPNGTYIDPGAGRLSGLALNSWLQDLFAGIPDFKVESVSVNPAGNRMIASQWVITGTWTQPFPSGPLAGVKPTGKSFTVPGASFIEWKDGKIASEVAYFDQMTLLTQIGVIAKK